MGLFSRRSDFQNDSALPDRAWLEAGEDRYRRLVHRHYGSPETIAAGGGQRVAAGDMAAGLFFFQKSIDLLHTLYDFSGMAQRRPSPADDRIIGMYLTTLSAVRAARPGAPIGASVQEVTHRLRTISTIARDAGLPADRYLIALQQLSQIAPEVDTSRIFWRNPGLPGMRDR